jgi:hypothetical protein
MKKIIKMTILNFIILTSIVNASGNVFIDIQKHWAEENIVKLAEMGIVTGYDDSTFKPENEITIMEFLKLLVETGEYTLVRNGNAIYPDFYYETAKAHDLLKGFEEIDVAKIMTRNEMVNILANFIDIKDIKVNKNIFKDLDEKNKTNVLKLTNLNVINGYGDRTFRGQNNVTRAEATTVIVNVLKIREKLIKEKQYDISLRNDLSNYIGGGVSGIKPFYEIKDGELLFYDSGRYAQLEAYSVSSKIIKIENIIKIIHALVNEKAYVSVMYIPSKYTINELKIYYGKNERKTLCGEYDFAFTYYENDTYKLADKSLNNKFSNNCYLRVDLINVYDDNWINKYKKEKLMDAFKIEFESNASGILNYMLAKSKNYERDLGREKEFSETKTFGNYIVNYYQKENDIPKFYIERK